MGGYFKALNMGAASMAVMSLLGNSRLSLPKFAYGSGKRSIASAHNRINRSKPWITNGAQECARRRRQIAASSLRIENGLELG